MLCLFNVWPNYFTERTESFHALWKKRRIFNERTEGYVPISTLLCDADFDLRQLLQVPYGILRCLFGLHVRGVTQRNLKLSDIYVERARVIISYVFVLLVVVYKGIYQDFIGVQQREVPCLILHRCHVLYMPCLF